MTRWKPIAGFEGYYEVSDDGQVRSVPRVVTRKNGAKLTVGGRVLKANRPSNPRDYPSVGLYKPGSKEVHKKVHILVAEAFLGERPNGYYVCHNNGIPTDNRVENLRYGTPHSNSLDTIRHGRHKSSQRTHCPRGHKLEGMNLLPSAVKVGRRACRSCAQARSYLHKKGVKSESALKKKSDSVYARLMNEQPNRTQQDADAEMQEVMRLAAKQLHTVSPIIFPKEK